MRSTVFALLLTASLAAAAGPQTHGDSPALHLAVGFGVDTARCPNHEIFGLWQAYLTSHPESLRASPHWSHAEQARWPGFDLLRSYVYQGFTRFTVVQLAPAPGLDSTYLIRTLVAGLVDSAQDVKPLALYRVYATREEGRWVLANALPRQTRTWKHDTIGHVTFVYPPTHVLARARAQATAAFVDSLARAFSLPVPQVGYYFTDDLDGTFRAMGLDFVPVGPDTAGGRSDALNRLVFVGSSSGGETNRHELGHIVFAPLVGPRTAHFVAEGLVTWLGGSAGLDYRDLLPGLRRYVDAHPEVTLQSIMTNPPIREGTLDVGYDGFAVLCEMVYEKRGVPGIRQLVQAGSSVDSLLPAAARLLDIPRAELDAAWRRRALASSR